MRLEWQMYWRAVRAELEAERARSDRERYRAEAEAANARVTGLERLAGAAQKQLSELVTTRRYRLAQSIAAPLDWVRGRRRST